MTNAINNERGGRMTGFQAKATHRADMLAGERRGGQDAGGGASHIADSITSTTASYLLAKYGKLTITPKQFADEAGCTEGYVRIMLANGELPGVKMGRRWKIPIIKVAAFLDGDAR